LSPEQAAAWGGATRYCWPNRVPLWWLTTLGVRATVLVAANYGSVTDADAGEAMVKTAVDNFGRLDILINNAGILRDKSFKKMDDAMWDAVIDVHLRGTYLVTKAAWKQFLEQGEGGRIVNTSSTSGLIGNFGQANYGAAKAGIAGFTRVLALEGRKSNITVNTLAPAAFSRMTEDLMPDAEKAAEALAPEKVSPPIVWLCTDDAARITGQQFCVRGNRVSLLSWQVTDIKNLSGMSLRLARRFLPARTVGRSC